MHAGRARLPSPCPPLALPGLLSLCSCLTAGCCLLPQQHVSRNVQSPVGCTASAAAGKASKAKEYTETTRAVHSMSKGGETQAEEWPRSRLRAAQAGCCQFRHAVRAGMPVAFRWSFTATMGTCKARQNTQNMSRESKLAPARRKMNRQALLPFACPPVHHSQSTDRPHIATQRAPPSGGRCPPPAPPPRASSGTPR